MPRLRPPPHAVAAGAIRVRSPALIAALTLLEKIEASTLSEEAKAAAKMLCLNNLVLGRMYLSGRRWKHRIPLVPRFPVAE
jgi:hypothetical protein